MADEYIRKQDAVNVVANTAKIVASFNYQYAIDALLALTPADVVQVVHGKWIDEDPAFAEYFANCSVCGYEIDVHNERGYFNFCPNCGAKMDGGDEHG